MFAEMRACGALLGLTLVLCSIVYPTVLLGIGQALLPGHAQGSLLFDPDGKPIGSKLIAQPFAGDQYFFPRPSAVAYNAAASGASNWGANNYLLRDRVARALGPIVKYRGEPDPGRLVGPDIEAWFQQDQFAGNPGIVAQWASAHPVLAAKWVLADPLNTTAVTTWQSSHQEQVAEWKRENPSSPEPKPEELAVAYFSNFSNENPGKFPSIVTTEGTTEKSVQPVSQGTEIQSIFFDMWRQEHPDVELQPVPADLVMASGSGLDPHITLDNAMYQLDRVAGKWTEITSRNAKEIRSDIEALLKSTSSAPLGGFAGVPLVNVLEVNLALRARYNAVENNDK